MITADLYCQQLQTIMEKLAVKELRLNNLSSLLLLLNNARPHTLRQMVAKLEELLLEYLGHPPYSPELALTDYPFFRNLVNFLQVKKTIPMSQSKPPSKILLTLVSTFFSPMKSIDYI